MRSLKEYFRVAVCLPVILLLPILAFAQGAVGDALTVSGVDNYTLNGVIGSVTLDGVSYSQIRLMPELRIWKFGFGFDLDLLIDGGGKARREDWDEWQDVIKKVFYVRFAKREDPFYFRVMNIPDYTLGHGLTFEHYSNMLRYPEIRNIGTFVGCNIPKIGLGFEAFTHNIMKNEIIGGRARAKPLEFVDARLFRNLSFGLNAGIDRNQYRKYEDRDEDNIPDIYDRFPKDPEAWADSDNDGIPDQSDIDIDGDNSLDHPSLNEFVETVYPGIADYYSNLDTSILRDSLTAYPIGKSIMVWSLDYDLPLIDKDTFKLSNYGEFARIDGYGNGLIFPALGLSIPNLEAKLEFRNFSDGFLPGIFDRLYDDQRAELIRVPNGAKNFLYSLKTKDQILSEVKASTGWYGSLSSNLFKVLKVQVAYQDMYGEQVQTGKSLWASLGIDTKVLPKLKEAELSYAQTNMKYISFDTLRAEGVQLSAKAAYALADNAYLVGKYSEHYSDLNNDGRIKGAEEIRSSTSFGVEFRF